MGVDMATPWAGNNLEWALEETEKVQKRLDEVLKPHTVGVYLLLGMVPNATRRIFTEIGSQTPQDITAAFHASRLFADALASFTLLRKGLAVQTTTLLRSQLETTAQAVALLRNADMAASWLNGRQYTPS